MSFLHAVPDAVKAAASNIAGIGSEISTANAAAALPTTGVMAAAADQVSAQVAALFSSHAQGYQQISAQMAEFHEKFVQALGTSANAYAATESSAAQSLMNAANAPVAQLLGQPLAGSSAGGLASNIANAAAKATTQVQSVFQGVGSNGLSLLGLAPTGGIGGLAASSALGRPLTAQAAPAAVLPVSWATAIQNFYLGAEPYLQYGSELAQYAVGWLPYVGILSGQIPIYYDLLEPMVQSGLFNITDWLAGTISFSQGLSNFNAVTAASINQFISNEQYWFWSFFPPLPPRL